MKFNSAIEVEAHWNQIDKIANDDGVTSHWIQMQMLEGNDRRLSAISAWRDLSPELQTSKRAGLNNKIFNVLFDSTEPLQWGEPLDKDERSFTFDADFDGGFASQFEAGGRKMSFGHLVDALANHSQFQGVGHEAISDMLNEPYAVYDGGADTNIVFLKSDLKARGLEMDDLYDNANYPMIRAMKEGKHLTFEILDESEKVEGFAPGMHQLSRLKELKEKLMERDADSSIWTASRLSQDGKSMEVVLMTGNMHERSDRQVVARWKYKDKDENGNSILKTLKYDGVQNQLKVLSAYKRGNFMDIENDEDIKDDVARWIKEGPSKLIDSIPSFMEEIIVSEWSPINIGKFEYNEVVVPFWEKYKHLGKEAFANKWEEVRRQETFAFEDKYWDLHFKGIIDVFRADVVPFRHGAGSYSKQGGLGGRNRSTGKPSGLFFDTEPDVYGGGYKTSARLKRQEAIIRNEK
jgi:hypothetical protein